jgi:hypothetical protein
MLLIHPVSIGFSEHRMSRPPWTTQHCGRTSPWERAIQRRGRREQLRNCVPMQDLRDGMHPIDMD